MFGTEVPTFNMKGQTKVKTACGACVSILIFITTLAFALVKMDHLVKHKNPNVTTNVSPLEAGTKFSTASDGFMMAFAAVNTEKGAPLNDPRYVRWGFLHEYHMDEDEIYKKTLGLLHPCTEEELLRLDPPENQYLAEDIKSQQNSGNLFCMDW